MTGCEGEERSAYIQIGLLGAPRPGRQGFLLIIPVQSGLTAYRHAEVVEAQLPQRKEGRDCVVNELEPTVAGCGVGGAADTVEYEVEGLEEPACTICGVNQSVA